MLGALNPLARAETILLHDLFNDGSRADQNLPSSAAWISSSGSSTVFLAPGGLTQNISGGRHLLAYFAPSPTEIAVNDVLELTLKITFTGPANVSGAFRVGLLNSASSVRPTADNHGGTSSSNSAIFENYLGYRSDMNLVPPVDTTTNLNLRKRAPAIQGLLLANAAYEGQTSIAVPVDPYAVLNAVTYTVTLSVYRQAEGRARISYEMTGPGFSRIFATGLDETSIVTSFDGVAVGTISNATTAFTLNEVKVRTYTKEVVPVDAPLLAIAPADTDLIVSSTSQEGVFYQLQRNATLAPDTWTNVGTAVAGTGSTLEWLISTEGLPEGPQYFFRLSVAP